MRRLAALLLLSAALAGGGCASLAPPGSPERAVAPGDPWEDFNRQVFAFNDAVDQAVLAPVAKAYRFVMPDWASRGVTNVYANFQDVWSAANHLLQGKIHSGLEMGMRVIVNTSFGLGGLLDPATDMGLVRRPEDLGQTLAVWGMPSGPFVVLPLFGPSTVRDSFVRPADVFLNPVLLAEDWKSALGLALLDVIDVRSNLLGTTELVDEIALDRYSFVRDAYLARRLEQIFDGAPPLEPFVDDPGDDPPSR